ncbi:RpiB/LacA/LacB family sugar-phosphate isomerase [Georgenia sp. Z1491]|uniref:RpiB/LacA/LacB family sugar-phosphate isomerase n=1 Tax=Georgenia sp. Z1491 TaxID=3416707 RepID=UPI003CF9D5D4
MRLIIGADHAGFPMKETARAVLEKLGHTVVDVGTHSEEPVDFPDIARAVAEPILAGETDRGVLVCGTGVGAAIAANKIPGIRATVAHDTYSARQGVEHDDVNVICVGAWLVGPTVIEQVVTEFLAAEFSTDPDCRRRVEKLHQLELEAAAAARRPGA